MSYRFLGLKQLSPFSISPTGWAVGALLLLGLMARVIGLDHWPGIHGDEAWYGAQAQQLLEGGAVSQTPSGNYPGPFQLGSLVIIQLLKGSGLMWLRLPTVLSSVVQIILIYVLGRRYFNSWIATFSAVALTVLPIAIAYARFGWDPSHSGLPILGAMWFALRGSLFPTALALILAVSVHPTNVFVLPLLLFVYGTGVPHLSSEVEQANRHKQKRVISLGLLVAAALITVLVVTSGSISSSLGRHLTAFPPDISWWSRSINSLVSLFTGDTVLRYIVGAPLGGPTGWIINRAVGSLLLATVGVAIYQWWWPNVRNAPERAILLGWLASLVSFFIVAGPRYLQPSLERYGIWAVTPTILAVAVACHRLRLSRYNGPLLALAFFLLASFYVFYLQRLSFLGSETEPTFRTAEEDPKLQSARLLASIAHERRLPVLAESYWIYWPLRYFDPSSRDRLINASTRDTPAWPDKGCAVGFSGSGFTASIPVVWERRFLSADLQGRGILEVWCSPQVPQ